MTYFILNKHRHILHFCHSFNSFSLCSLCNGMCASHSERKEHIRVFQRKSLIINEKQTIHAGNSQCFAISVCGIVCIISNNNHHQRVQYPVVYLLTFIYILRVYMYTLSSITPNLLSEDVSDLLLICIFVFII